ncbi:MAG TPA: carbohydrate kinase family protein [Bryobacteraceae bacterium]|jgi:sugar/nucleoside kinase (ribokinase family)|nr:carbohydrate kinase family protein [Bryobacteraceae bacterium]
MQGVLCSGNIVYDTLVRPVDELYWGPTTFVDSIEAHAGGNGASTSRALSRLGVPVRLLTAVGADNAAKFLLETLAQDSVDISRVERVPGPSASTVAMVKSSGERKFFHCLGASNAAFAKPIEFTPELCAGMTHYHQASLFVLRRLRARGPETLINARKAGLTTSFDTNWDPAGEWMGSLRPCLPHIDILFMNEVEAEMITGSTDPAAGAKVVLNEGLRTAVMMLGKRGCAIYTQDQEVFSPAFDVEAKDSTGAGDCFVAGFLAAYLDGASLAEAGEFANAVAALSVQQVGAVTGVLFRSETEAWIRHHRP